MSARKKLEDKFIHLTSTIGKFDWVNGPITGSVPFGNKHEFTWAALTLLMEIDEVMNITEETIDWFTYHLQITDNHHGQNVEVVRDASFRIATWLNTPRHFFDGYDNIDKPNLIRSLGGISSYNEIPIVLESYGIEFEDTLDIIQRAIVPGWVITMPQNRFIRDIRQALVMFVLYKYRIITDFIHYKNEN
jgi:hypothetical protein